MGLAVIITGYIYWHYINAFGSIFLIWRNILYFILHFFSIGPLFKTLFSPWRRLDEKYNKGFDPQAIVETLIVNTIMRVVGFVIRIFFIVFGLLTLIICFIGGILFIIIWITAPLLISTFLFLGTVLLFE